MSRGAPESLAAFEAAVSARFQTLGAPLKLASAREIHQNGATGYELTFSAGGATTRVVGWFHGGNRYTLMTMEPPTPSARKNAADLDALIGSVRLFQADPAARAQGFVVPLLPGQLLPAGTRVDTIQLASGAPLTLEPHEQLAFIFVTDVKTLRLERRDLLQPPRRRVHQGREDRRLRHLRRLPALTPRRSRSGQPRDQRCQPTTRSSSATPRPSAAPTAAGSPCASPAS